jgi:hypothetical protein
MLKFNIQILSVAVILLGVSAGPAQAQSMQGDSCQGAMSALLSEWRAISFEPPSKPGQANVAGKDGHVTSAGQFNYMAGLIREASMECDRGDAAAAMQHINAVRDGLGRSVQPNILVQR